MHIWENAFKSLINSSLSSDVVVTGREEDDSDNNNNNKNKKKNCRKLLSHQPTRLSRNVYCAHVVAQSEKNKYTIQYGHIECGTLARVFSQTLAQGNSKKERSKETQEGKKSAESIERSKAGTKEIYLK